MPRRPRIHIDGVPLHIVQRGHNREPCFFGEGDYSSYLHWLGKAIREAECLLHAYVLMTNHVHLLLTPGKAAAVPKLLISLGRRYVQYINRSYGRTGTLWDSRYKSSLVQPGNYLLACQRYIELNPVRAGLATHPGEYRWSSYHANALGTQDGLVSSHELYDRLGKSKPDRQQAYRELLRASLPQTEVDAIRDATNKNWALGNDEFKRRIEALSGRRPDRIRLGRPAIGSLPGKSSLTPKRSELSG